MRRVWFSLLALLIFLAPAAQSQRVNYLYNYGTASVHDICWQQASDGNLYSDGDMFNPTTLASPTAFPLPSCSFIQGIDTNFYAWEPSTSPGTITKVTLAGNASTLVTLTSSEGYGIAQIIQAADGTFYGVASEGGVYGYGTVFSFTPAGVVTKLYDFTNGPDGSGPENILQASDGNLYGQLDSGGIFKLTLGGSESTLSGDTNTLGLVEGPNATLYRVGGSVTLGGTVGSVSVPDTLGALSGPCYLGGDLNLYCSATFTDESSGDMSLNIVQLPPTGGGNVYIALGYVPGGGTEAELYAHYALAGDGSFYGYSFAEVSSGGNVNESQFIFNAYGEPEVPALQLSLSAQQVVPGESTTLTWNAANAYSDTMKLCFASGAWSGVQASSGSITAPAPPTPGIYRYALTCGGVETGSVLLYVAVPQVALTVTPSYLAAGVSATLQATVTGNNGTATGNVTFSAGSALIGTVPLNASGVATLTLPTTEITPGNYSVIASYSGSKKYTTAVSSSVPVTLLAKKAVPTIYLGVSPTTVAAGGNVSLSAYGYGTGYGNGYTQSGTMTFYYGSVYLGSAPIMTGGAAKLSLTVPANQPGGNYSLTATYSGTAYAASATSAPVVLSVTGNPSATLTLTASPVSVTPPAAVALTATESTAAGKPAPTGTVRFYNGTTYLGSASLNGSGSAAYSYATTGLSAGSYTLNADYLGDANYVADSASTTLAVE